MRRRTVAVAATALTFGVLAGPAQASFPGENGLIAYPASGNLFLVDPTISPPVTQQITTAGGFVGVSFDATGKRLVAENAAGVVFLDPKPESTITPLPGGDVNDSFPAFDPTGTKVTFSNAGDIFTQNVDGSGRTNLTAANPNTLVDPDWSPDGQFIALQDNTDGLLKRITVADGTTTTLTPPASGCAGGTPCQAPSWAPDGLTVAFDRDPGATGGIFEISSDGLATISRRLSMANDDGPAVSPDGTQVVFDDATSTLALVPTDGSLVKTNVGAVFVSSNSQKSWGIKPAPPPPPPPPDNQFTLGALTLNKDKGTASQTVTVPGPGELVLGGSGIVPKRPAAKAKRSWRLAVTGGDVPVLIKAKGDKKKQLKKEGKVKVTATFTFTPTGGTANTLTKTIKLKKTIKK